MFEMQLNDDVLFIIDRMRSCGYSAHVVGGSVRDSLIGRELGDFDITTDARPEETKAVFAEYRTVDTGIRHGTVTLVLNGVPYEITTYRVDGDYKDNRHPESVTYTASLAEDLARRDFTVNAMAYSPYDGLADPFGGVADAKGRVIRAVGDPLRRFDEDALRILRALRFASVLGFDIEENTAKAARALAERLVSISKERIYTELKKLICGQNAREILLEYSGIISVALGGFEVKNLPAKEKLDGADYLTRLAVLFDMNSDDPAACADRILGALKTDKFTRTHTISVLNAYKDVDFSDEKHVLYGLVKHGLDAVEGALLLGALEGALSDEHMSVLKRALECEKPYMVSGLAIRGGDLTSLGIKGERVGETLNALLFAVIDGCVENDKASLISYLERMMEA